MTSTATPTTHLAKDGTVIIAVYSSGAIGRLVADDVVGLVRYLSSHG